MNLSDKTIKEYMAEKGLKIDPFNPKYLNPASIDFSLTSEGFRMVKATGKKLWEDPEDGKVHAIIDPLDAKSHTTVPVVFEIDKETGEEFTVMKPFEFRLAAVNETIAIPNGLTAQLAGKSSLARLGLFIHVTAGFGDPGWNGVYILELFYVGEKPIRLTKDMLIAQVVFTMTHDSEQTYDMLEKSKYQNQIAGQGSLYHENKELLNEK